MSTISIVGAGNVARGIATRALAAGFDVQILVRNEEQGKTLQGELGGPVTVATIGSSVVGDLVALTVPFSAVPEVAAASGGFAGKTVIDATNPLNAEFTGLATEPDTSGAETIAALVPAAKVVKAFNTVFAGNVVAGEKNGQPLDLLVAADDADAKAAVVAFAEKAGFRVIDTGALSQARTMEALAWLHMQLQFTRGTNFASAIQLVD
ncbi:MAG TPA: NAD(P)-binding domain-containing protein [Terrimesophilobacter sp.]|jgi:Predicted dinucleotide-binding enzymes|uniref:NADPH-dependent F420 reductase n=1 Tax=Terrimesophilobacter sp. TaxID=2906435 RepID=UPI002F923FCC